jgi:hypothetical protein
MLQQGTWNWKTPLNFRPEVSTFSIPLTGRSLLSFDESFSSDCKSPLSTEKNAQCVYLNYQLSVTMAGPSPHKPRRKVKKSTNSSEVSSVASTGRSSTTRPTYPLAAFLWPARSSVSQWETLPLILMAVGLFRWAAGLWGYSGMLEAAS